MTDLVPEERVDATKIDDPHPVAPHGKGSPYIINTITGGIAFLSPPGTPPVTSEDVRRWLEDFP